MRDASQIIANAALVREPAGAVSLRFMRGPARWIVPFVASIFTAAATASAEEAGEPILIRGTAVYGERLTLPPNAVFEAVVLDVSRADAPAEVIATFRREDPGSPPFVFAITVDPALLRPGARYGLRATIKVDGQLRFTTGTYSPVLATRSGDEVELLLVGVAAESSGKPP